MNDTIEIVDGIPTEVRKTELKLIKRNNFGLIENFEYKFTEEGFVDWRGLIPSKFLYINSDNKNRPRIEKKYGKAIEEIDIVSDKVSDSDLVITLPGIKFVNRLRGYNSVFYSIKESSQEYASVNCRVKFIPNYETEMREVEFADNACAHLYNTTGFGQKYLLEIATNRSLCRCVRNFLNINIVSREEIFNDTNVENEDSNSNNSSLILSPHDVLKKVAKDKKYDFEEIKKKLVKMNFPNAEKFEKFEDIPKEKTLYIIEKLQAKKES